MGYINYNALFRVCQESVRDRRLFWKFTNKKPQLSILLQLFCDHCILFCSKNLLLYLIAA